MSWLLKSEAGLIDIGVNLTHSSFDNILASTIRRAKNACITKLIITGTSEQESAHSLDICRDFSINFPNMIYSTCGVHPHNAKEFNNETAGNLKKIASNNQVVAIGETGLDFNRNFSSPKEQQIAFETQLELASELQLPVFLHEREAHERQLEILKHYRKSLKNAVIHCFTGTKDELFNYLDLDLYIGITGWICDERRGQELQKIVKNIPINRLMIETDAPFLLPRTIESVSKKQINEPAFLPWIVREISNHRSESMLEIAKETTKNATFFFDL